MVEKNKSTISLKKETRSLLSKIGKKDQTYDQLIRELIISKKKMDSLEDKTANLHSSEFNNT